MTASRLVHPPAGNNWRHSPTLGPLLRHQPGVLAESAEALRVAPCRTDSRQGSQRAPDAREPRDPARLTPAPQAARRPALRRDSPPDRRHPAGDSLEKTSLPKCYNDDTYVRLQIHWPKSGPYREAEARKPNMKNAKQTAIQPCRRTQLLDTESRPKNVKMQYKWTGWVRAGLDLCKRDRVQNTKMQNKGPVSRAAGPRRLKRDCVQIAPAMTVRCNVVG